MEYSNEEIASELRDVMKLCKWPNDIRLDVIAVREKVLKLRAVSERAKERKRRSLVFLDDASQQGLDWSERWPKLSEALYLIEHLDDIP